MRSTAKHDPNVFDLLKTVKIEFRRHEPCYDKNGAPADGSVHHLTEGQDVCISGKRLQEKLNSYYSSSQIVALVLHELSHLLGADEVQAEALQVKLLEVLKNDTVESVRKKADNRYHGIEGAFDFINITGIDYNCGNIYQLLSGILHDAPLPSGLEMEPPEVLEKLKNMSYRVLAMMDYTCVKDVAKADDSQFRAIVRAAETAVDELFQDFYDMKEEIKVMF